MHTLTLGTSIANLPMQRLMLQRVGSSRWYGAGLAFALAHFAFVPWVAHPIEEIVKGKSKEESTTHLRRWLYIHRVRSLLVDLPAWASFLVAALMTSPV